MRRRFGLCKFCEEIHEYGRWPHNCVEPALDLRSDFPSPMIMSSTLDDGRGHGVVNPVDGKRYANRRQFEAEVQAHGCTVMGNDPLSYKRQKPPEIDANDIVRDIKKSIEQLSAMSETERANMMAAAPVADASEMESAGVG